MIIKDILGYVVCHTCLTPKSVKQGKGKRSAFVHARCECGPDTRTGAAAQAELKQYKPLDVVQADIELLKNPVVKPNLMESKPNQTESKPNLETQSDGLPTPVKPNDEPNTVGIVTCVGIGSVLGLVFGGLIKSLKVVG